MPTVSFMYGDIGCVLNEPKKLTAQEKVQKQFLEHQIDCIKKSKKVMQDNIVYYQNKQTEYNVQLALRQKEFFTLLG